MNIQKRFWEKVSKTENCWNWLASLDKDGYGKIKFLGKNRRAHRMAWILINGKIPKGLYVLHKCDRPSCVNPAHLFLGTNEDNMKDMIKKDRSSRNVGELNPMTKFTKKQIKMIRGLVKTKKYFQHEIAIMFNTTQSNISVISNNINWKNI